MSMIHSHPVLDPNAHAKSMIDAVTGHQPSPLDGEYSSETATPKQNMIKSHVLYRLSYALTRRAV